MYKDRVPKLMCSLRIQTIATKYPTHLRQFYRSRRDLFSRPYAEQHAALLTLSFGATDSRTIAFGELGYEVSHIFANAELMQKRWALEHGVDYRQDHWLLDILEAQIEAFRPNILIFNYYSSGTAALLRNLKAECPSVLLVLAFLGEPLVDDPSMLREHDVILSSNPPTVDYLRSNGCCCYHVNHGFDPRVLAHIDTTRSPVAELIFLGSIVKHAGFHDSRERFLLELVEKTDIQIWSDIQQPCLNQRINTRLRQILYDLGHSDGKAGLPPKLLREAPLVRRAARWSRRPDLPPSVARRIARRARPPLHGLAMFQQLHDSRVAFNIHSANSGDSASNMRLYEATGVGTCLLTDWKANLPDLFEPDVEVSTYRTAEECVEKARHLLDHEDERQAIAAAGQRRTLRHHTVRQRVEQIDEIIRTHLR